MKFDAKNVYCGILCQYAPNQLGDANFGESDKLVELKYVLLYKVNSLYVRALDLNSFKLFQVKHGNTSNVHVYFENYLPDQEFLKDVHVYPFDKEIVSNEDILIEQAMLNCAFDARHRQKDCSGMAAM